MSALPSFLSFFTRRRPSPHFSFFFSSDQFLSAPTTHSLSLPYFSRSLPTPNRSDNHLFVFTFRCASDLVLFLLPSPFGLFAFCRSTHPHLGDAFRPSPSTHIASLKNPLSDSVVRRTGFPPTCLQPSCSASVSSSPPPLARENECPAVAAAAIISSSARVAETVSFPVEYVPLPGRHLASLVPSVRVSLTDPSFQCPPSQTWPALKSGKPMTMPPMK